LPGKGIYTQSLEADQDGVSTRNYTKAKAYCPISLQQKMAQKLMNRNIKGENIGVCLLCL